jgi:hypothetical protein
MCKSRETINEKAGKARGRTEGGPVSRGCNQMDMGKRASPREVYRDAALGLSAMGRAMEGERKQTRSSANFEF